MGGRQVVEGRGEGEGHITHMGKNTHTHHSHIHTRMDIYFKILFAHLNL